MEEKFDHIKNFMQHRKRINYWVDDFIHVLKGRVSRHDESKLQEPEKSMFEIWSPIVANLDVDDPEYKSSLEQMGVGLKHHYDNNTHHPEHYERGVDGMTLHDLVEMFYDWIAVCDKKKMELNIDYLKERFNLSDQLVNIFMNTTEEQDYWNMVQGVPVVNFTPDKYRGRYETKLWEYIKEEE